MSTADLVQSYYESLGRKDDRWQAMYTEDAAFGDPSGALAAEGKAAVIQSFVPFLKSVEEVKVRQIITQDGRACAIAAYVYVNPKGERLAQDVAEVWDVRDGKLARLTIYFDLTAYRKFMRG